MSADSTVTSVIPFNFNSNQIRAIDKDGEPWFVAKDIAEVLGYRDAEVMTRKLDGDELSTLNVWTLKGHRDLKVVNESGLYNAIFSSRKEEAKQFKRWVTSEVLPAIRKTGSYQLPTTSLKEKVEAQLLMVDFSANKFRLSDSSVLGLLRRVEVNNGLPNSIPDYVVDAPTDESSGGSKVHFSATALLEQNGVNLSAYKFNLLAIEHGFLEEKERDSTTTENKKKKFKLITEKGKFYGDNFSTDKNQKEPQPRWYEHKFVELLEVMGV